jgi:CheY-like chemotaxis protein
MGRGEGLTALVLDDDPAILNLLRKLLENDGFKVEAVGDGLEGLMKLEALRPDIVICDMMMPNLDGMAFTKAIKGHSNTKDIPLVFLSAKTDARSFADGMAAGAKQYVGKPFKHEELLMKVYKALGKR